jgi:hypothetical protein
MVTAAKGARTMTRPLGDPIEHLHLIRHMAQVTGVDLAASMAEGRLDQEEWAGMVTRCRGCQWASGCQKWLALPPEMDGVPALPPVQCVNKAKMSALAAE